MFRLGALLVLSRDLGEPERRSRPRSPPPASRSALALLAVTVDETDEAFANIVLGRPSRCRTSLPQVPQRPLVAGVSVVATVGALAIDLGDRTSRSCSCSAPFFVPLFGVLLADWLLAAGTTSRADVFGAPALRPGLVGAWLAGFAVYQWLYPLGPWWWVDLVERTDPPELGDRLDAAELPARLRARRGRARDACARPRLRPPHRLARHGPAVAVIGNLAADVVDGRPPGVGGGPFQLRAPYDCSAGRHGGDEARGGRPRELLPPLSRSACR